jgi:acetyl-CoA carboxylase biotin carboxylase subunit
MLRALREYVVVGIQTNIPFHLQLLNDARFRAGKFDTGFLEREFKMEPPDGHPDEEAALMLAAVLAHLKKRRPLAVESSRAGEAGWLTANRQRVIDTRAMAQRRGWRRTG